MDNFLSIFLYQHSFPVTRISTLNIPQIFIISVIFWSREGSLFETHLKSPSSIRSLLEFDSYNSNIGIILEFVQNADSRFYTGSTNTKSAFYHDSLPK